MKKLILLLPLALMLAACEPEPYVEPTPSAATDGWDARFVVLNEGVWGGNNASLGMYRSADKRLNNQWFSDANGRNLGEVAQDALLYGGRLYVVVWGSSSLEVVDTATGHATHVSLDQRAPRYIAAAGGHLYVSCYNPHSVVSIDTATLQVDATCTLGAYNPEGIAAIGGRLFVASDNIADATGTYTYDNRLYVLDQATMTVVDSVVVGRNPQKVMVVDDHHIVVNHYGEWDLNTLGTVGEGTAVVDVNTLEVRHLDQPLSNFTVEGGTIYGYYQSYAADGATVATYYSIDPATGSATPILPSCTIDNPYAIAVSPSTGLIYVATDGNRVANGKLACFAPDGTAKGSVEAGMFPSKVVFL